MTEFTLITHKGPGYGNTPATIEIVDTDNPHYKKCIRTSGYKSLSHVILFPYISYTEAVPACSCMDKEGMAYGIGAWARYHELKVGSAEKAADKAIELLLEGCLSTAIVLTYIRDNAYECENKIVATALTCDYISAALGRKGAKPSLGNMFTGDDQYLFIGN